jgi:hypothetical protein
MRINCTLILHETLLGQLYYLEGTDIFPVIFMHALPINNLFCSNLL